MKHQQAKRIFFNWLKKKGLYTQYKYYRHKANNNPNEGYHRSYLQEPEYYLMNAFTWARTKQGRPFWRNLHEEWRVYLYNLKYRYH